MKPMLELKHLCFEAETDAGVRQILKDVSLTVDERMVVITGPNGSGKSTMAKLIAGIEQPTSGQILLDGEDITHMSITERARRGISFAFQQPVRFKGITVFDLISIASGKKLSTNEACTYLSEVGLCARDYVNREVNASLSGGELKRIEIATMLARGTKMSIFDEPEAGIDLWSFQNLISVFEKMHEAIHVASSSSRTRSAFSRRPTRSSCSSTVRSAPSAARMRSCPCSCRRRACAAVWLTRSEGGNHHGCN